MNTFSHRCDRFEVLKKVRGRKRLFFDMSIWIELERGRTDAARSALALLRHGVANKQLLCPFQFTTIWELTKQDQSSRERLATLIEELSLNVAFAARDDVFAWECDGLVGVLLDEQPTKLLDSLFVPPGYYLSDSAECAFPDGGLPEDEQAEMSRHLQQKTEELTLTELVKMRVSSVEKMPHPNIPYQSMARNARAASGGNKAALFHGIAVEFTNQYVAPCLDRLPELRRSMARAALVAKAAGPGGSPLDFVLRHTPAIRNAAEALAGMLQETGRKDNPNDFYDLESLPVPLAYADAVVFRDKRIRNLLQDRTDLLKQNKCHYFYDLPEFITYLKGQPAQT